MIKPIQEFKSFVTVGRGWGGIWTHIKLSKDCLDIRSRPFVFWIPDFIETTSIEVLEISSWTWKGPMMVDLSYETPHGNEIRSLVASHPKLDQLCESLKKLCPDIQVDSRPIVENRSRSDTILIIFGISILIGIIVLQYKQILRALGFG